MRALRFHKVGSLDELKVEELPRPIPAAGEVLIQVKAAAINPSDVKNVQGKMHETSLPRIPGRDFAGIVVEGPGICPAKWFLVRAAIWASVATAATRNSSRFQRARWLPLPKNLSFEQATGIGVAYITAWAALVITAELSLVRRRSFWEQPEQSEALRPALHTASELE
jgi:NADPH2:quinone reductase